MFSFTNLFYELFLEAQRSDEVDFTFPIWSYLCYHVVYKKNKKLEANFGIMQKFRIVYCIWFLYHSLLGTKDYEQITLRTFLGATDFCPFILNSYHICQKL